MTLRADFDPSRFTRRFFDHAETFAGAPVVPYDPSAPLSEAVDACALAVGHRYAYATRHDPPKRTFDDHMRALTADPRAPSVARLVVCAWWSPEDAWDSAARSAATPLEALCAAEGRLTGLRAVFLADLVQPQRMLSEIEHDDVSYLLAAHPRLEGLCLRGSDGLRFSPLRHDGLRELVMESGNLQRASLRDLFGLALPNLERLTVWAGDPDYGADTDADDWVPVLSGKLFPKLRHLGVCNATYSRDLIARLCGSPLAERLESIDLSMGTVDGDGAAMLIGCRALSEGLALDLRANLITRARFDALMRRFPRVLLRGQRYHGADDALEAARRYVVAGE